ncbi:unnamed protein product [Prorocentrum cordatum]|uniref:Uncharacterized protein n=1 Tax=Prorocentrum cordatum TaxID=2364126 RepID=A0ABN9W0Q9_9DINO|nr:unnamed protein product [Polarella glacialis]
MEAPRGAADAAVLVEAAVRAAVQGRAPRRTVAAVARSALSAALFALREAPPAAAPPPAAAAAAPATEGAAAPKARSAAWVERRRRRRQRLAARRRDGAGAEAAPAGESAALAALPPQAEADADGDDAIDDDRWADGLVRGGAAAAAAAAPPAAGSDAEQRDLVARFCAVKMAGLDPAAEVVAALMSVGADELRRQIAAASSSLGSSPAGRGPPGAPQPGEHSRFFSSSMAPQQQRNGYFKCYSCSYAWNWKSKQACHWCGKALAPWTDVPPPVQGAWAARVSAAVQAEAKNTQPTNAEGGWEPWSSWPKSRRRRGKGNGKDQDEDWWASKNDTPKARSAEDILAELQAVAPHIDKAAIDGIKSQIPPPQPQKPADLNEIYSRAQATERRCKNNLERLLESEQKALNWYTERKQANPQRQRQLTLKARRPHPIINTMDAVLDPFDELAELDAHFDYAESGQYATAPPETLSSVGGDETAQTVDHPVVEPAALDPISYAIPLDLWQKQWQEALPTPCKQPHAHFAYRHWEHDADPLNLKYAKWVSALENTMISHHQIDPKEAAAYTGRAQGYQLSWKKTAAAPGRVHAHDPHAEWWAITLTLIMRYAALFDKPKHTALMEQQAIIIQQCADHFNSHMHDLQFEKDEDTIFRWFALVWAPHLDKDDTDDLVTITATWASRALSAALAKSKRAYGAWLAQQWKHRPGVLHAHVKPAPVRHTEAYTSNLTIADPTVIIDNKKQQWQQVWHATETSDDILQALTKFAACGEVLWSRGPRVISGKAIHPSHVLAAIPKWQMFFCVKCGHTATHQEALSGLEAWSAWAKRGGSRGWRALRAGAARARPVGRGPTAAAASRERAGPRAGRGRQMAAPSAARLRAALAAKAPGRRVHRPGARRAAPGRHGRGGEGSVPRGGAAVPHRRRAGHQDVPGPGPPVRGHPAAAAEELRLRVRLPPGGPPAAPGPREPEVVRGRGGAAPVRRRARAVRAALRPRLGDQASVRDGAPAREARGQVGRAAGRRDGRAGGRRAAGGLEAPAVHDRRAGPAAGAERGVAARVPCAAGGPRRRPERVRRLLQLDGGLAGSTHRVPVELPPGQRLPGCRLALCSAVQMYL